LQALIGGSFRYFGTGANLGQWSRESTKDADATLLELGLIEYAPRLITRIAIPVFGKELDVTLLICSQPDSPLNTFRRWKTSCLQVLMGLWDEYELPEIS